MIKNGKLYILGHRGEELLCLQYKLEPEKGRLVLENHASLAI